MNKVLEIFGGAMTAAGGGIITASAVDELDKVLGIIFSIIGIISLLLTIFNSVYDKIRQAKADGKITKEEVKDITNTIIDGADKVKDKVEEVKDQIKKP